uniref:Prokaryotic-type class I peptide chain release factors domain-containing protein n=1 Tax=Kalanchoe fedtschenkoi TaxID=63787 RepID=A0A7N0U1B2_KALFE
MSAIRAAGLVITGKLLNPVFAPAHRSLRIGVVVLKVRVLRREFGYGGIRCLASDSGDGGGKKAPARLSQMREVLKAAEERASVADDQPTPKITLDHVTMSFARSGGAGGQNVNKVNTKVDMRFNVKNAYWLSDRIRDRIMVMEKNRINKDGDIVISSTKTRTQKGNIDDALEKLQAIIDAASYVPPPPSEEQKKKIEKLAAIGEHKRLQNKKELSQKKQFRRTKESWD